MMKTYGRPSNRVDVVCAICGITFKAKPTEIKRGAGRYCSQACAAVARQRKNPARAEPEAPRQPMTELICENLPQTVHGLPAGLEGNATLDQIAAAGLPVFLLVEAALAFLARR
jgi:hypothetical protein